MRRSLLLMSLGFVSGSIPLVACSGLDGEIPPPVFAAEITGAVTQSAAGPATYGVVRDGGSTGFTIVMEDTVTGSSIVLQKPAIARPFPGTYAILPPDQVGPLDEYRGVARIVVDGVLQQYEATGGELVIRELTSVTIKGSMSFDAVRTSPCCDPAPVTISVAGTFTAVQGPVAAAR